MMMIIIIIIPNGSIFVKLRSMGCAPSQHSPEHKHAHIGAILTNYPMYLAWPITIGTQLAGAGIPTRPTILPESQHWVGSAWIGVASCHHRWLSEFQQWSLWWWSARVLLKQAQRPLSQLAAYSNIRKNGRCTPVAAHEWNQRNSGVPPLWQCAHGCGRDQTNCLITVNPNTRICTKRQVYYNLLWSIHNEQLFLVTLDP